MNSVEQVMAELNKKGTEQTRKTLRRHGVTGDLCGVKIADLKPIAKQIKGNQELACQLFETGNYDAMYLSGLVADGSQMTKRQLDSWAKMANDSPLCDYTVSAVASEHPRARDLAVKWIKSKQESIACCGWYTYVGIIATRPDEELDQDEIKELIDRVVGTIHSAPNKVRYAMNNFVIAVGTYVKPLLKQAKQAARSIGVVTVDMGDTACKVPLATAYIAKVEKMGRVGKKRKTMKC
jgi:3-methyladenine DNA glycosylase AlkD